MRGMAVTLGTMMRNHTDQITGGDIVSMTGTLDDLVSRRQAYFGDLDMKSKLRQVIPFEDPVALITTGIPTSRTAKDESEDIIFEPEEIATPAAECVAPSGIGQKDETRAVHKALDATKEVTKVTAVNAEAPAVV